MKFKNEQDSIMFEALEFSEETIRKKLQIVKKSIDRKKSRDMKNNWRRNKHQLKKGIKKWHQSTQGKRFHRALGRFNSLRESKDGIDAVTEALFGLNSIETHLILELKYYEPDIEALSQFLEIFGYFNDDVHDLKEELTEAYIYGNLKEDTIQRVEEIFTFFVDPKILYYSKRESMGLSNDMNQMGEEELKNFLNDLKIIEENVFENNISSILEDIFEKEMNENFK